MRNAAIMAAVLGLVLAGAPRLAEAQPPTVCFGDDVNDARSTDVDDYLAGTGDRDIAALGDGADQYFGDGGPDELCGNLGDDLLVGEDGADSLDGDDGNDLLAGFQGADLLKGGDGRDEVRGNGGDDVLKSNADDGLQDDIYDGGGSDAIVGNPEDVWHKCDDSTPDDHDGFDGITVPDPDC